MFRSNVAATALVIAAAPLAHPQFRGPQTYPEFRNMSGLPGSGFGVNSKGRAEFSGAMAYATPVAYSLAPWEVVGGMTIVSYNTNRFAFLDRSNGESSNGNGSLQVQFGLPLGKSGELSYGVLVKSSYGDNAGCVQWTPPLKGPVKLALGIQDVRGRGGSAGNMDPTDRAFSRSVYVVGTWQAASATYVSVGMGDQHRFRGAFGNASHSITPRLKAVVEYDTFNWNWIVAYDLGAVHKPIRPERRSVRMTAFVGQEAGRFGLWGFNLSF